MSNLGEVEKALDVIYSTGNTDVKLMHCTTDYPTCINDVNLKAIYTMMGTFHVPVGFSDHTLGYEAAIAAVALGATIIEKHITIDRNMDGSDHKASMPPNEFLTYVQSIRNTEKLLGDGIKKPTSWEIEMMKTVRRSIVANYDLKNGTVITKDMINYKRPGYGIKPEMVDYILGRVLKKDLCKDEVFMWEYV